MLLVALLVVVMVLATLPAPPDAVSLGWDKLNHLAAFVALALVAGLATGDGPSPGRSAAWVSAALLAYGALIEVVQHFVPSRSSEWGDLAADALGIGLGLLLWAALRWWSLRPARRPDAGG